MSTNPVNRIDATLAAQPSGLWPFIPAGYPSVAFTASLLRGLESLPIRGVEIGFPFSDPIADGPVIQASMSYALDRGIKPSAILNMVAQQRARLKMGLVAMVSYSIVHRMDSGAFLRDCKAAGIDGVIIPDLPVEESATVRDQVTKADLVCSFLIAPTTPIARAETIARACTGFVYVLSRAGITGERTELPADLPEHIRRLRGVTDLPIAVGFGVSSAEQVAQVVSVADAAIVGSAIMRRVAQQRERGADAVVTSVADFVAGLAQGLNGTAVVR